MMLTATILPIIALGAKPISHPKQKKKSIMNDKLLLKNTMLNLEAEIAQAFGCPLHSYEDAIATSRAIDFGPKTEV